MTANMYRIGDYVYFETATNNPYQIRRIEELNKTTSGNVEAKVMCFFRRRDIPGSIIGTADKIQTELEEENVNGERHVLTAKQKHQLKHRELFLSRQVETIPATHIRGKCTVTLLNENESVIGYLNKEDTFFYTLVFDPAQRSLLADKGEIRVGAKYQVDPPPYIKGKEETDPRMFQSLETLLWTPNHGLTDKQIDQFLVTSRSVGTFARALDCSSSVKQPSLHMSAAAASRDITLFHAMDTLHKHDYILSEAVSSLVPSTGPVLCRDEMEEWSASEANMFEEALEKYGKDFKDIRKDFLPWKSVKNVVEYYYMWKTTDRYVQQKRVKAVEAESKLKQVYIPNYGETSNSLGRTDKRGSPADTFLPDIKPNISTLNNNKGVVNGTCEVTSSKPCESCNGTTSTQWFAWGPPNLQCKLCSPCWYYWKKYGGLKAPSKYSDIEVDKKKTGGSTSDEEKSPSSIMSSHRPHRCNITGCLKEFKVKAHLARHYATAHGLAVRSGSPRPIMKTRTAFYLSTTPLTRLSRRICRNYLQSRHAARSPFWSINAQAIKQECQHLLAGKSAAEIRSMLPYRQKERGSVTHIATKLGHARNYELIVPDWLLPTERDKIPRSEKIAFPKPPKAPDGSLLYERIPNKPELEKAPSTNSIVAGLKRKPYDEMNGLDGDNISMSGWSSFWSESHRWVDNHSLQKASVQHNDVSSAR